MTARGWFRAAGLVSLVAGALWFLKPAGAPLWRDGIGAMWLATGWLWLLRAQRET